MTCLEAALRYRQLGFSVIPVKGSAYSQGNSPKEKYGNGKLPLIPWKDFQSRIATEEEIQSWFQKWPDAAIAIITGDVSGLASIDCDSREAIDLFENQASEAFTTPIQITPRGGRQYVCQYQDGIPTKVEIAPKMDVRGQGGYFLAAPSTNAMNGNVGSRYEWLDGFDLFSCPVAPIPDSCMEMIRHANNTFYIYAQGGVAGPDDDCLQLSTKSTKSTNLFSEGRRDVDLFHVANCAVKGGMETEYVREVLLRLINSWGEHDEKWIEAKIKSAVERAARRERNLAAEVEEFILSTTGDFLSTDVVNCLQCLQRQERKNVSIILKRLSLPPKPLIRKVGTKNGCWCRIDDSVEFMDFVNVDFESTINIHLPLGIHKKTIFFPKSVIVLAGVTGYGKTTFALNFIRDNMMQYEIYYWNSEMSRQALNKKLAYFNTPASPADWRMKAIPGENWDWTNIGDKIFPDAINVIDYLEPEGDKPYGIHGPISAIINRLNKGMAFITVQKKPGAKMGTGGIYSAKAASLYLALEWGSIEIVKNRFREEDENPNLNCIDFEIRPGAHFVPSGGWYNGVSKKKESRYDEFVTESK